MEKILLDIYEEKISESERARLQKELQQARNEKGINFRDLKRENNKSF
ncbi:hypothetical protein HY988_04100 [Candidatus Micrarchaeota archaeon]|nr:hypothetical protein [Candidatus Micrarchaeota archaeon]